MKRTLILEDGTIFTGKGIGSNKEVICEIVFNTSMGGYIETITDPTYIKKAVVMTYPLIGNYGFMEEDSQSYKPWTEAIIAREICEHDNNFRSQGKLEEYLNKHDIPALYDIDTRTLTKHLRDKGTMLGMITSDDNIDIDKALNKIKSYTIDNCIQTVSTKDTKVYNESGKYNVAVLDFGVKKSIIDALVKRNCKVTLYPYNTQADTIINSSCDGLVLSNGPDNPSDYEQILPQIKKLYEANIPILAICVGHQILAAAAVGVKTVKLKYGHIGEGQSVKDLETGKIYVTSQNHNYTIDKDSIDTNVAKINYININDNTVEGLKYIDKKIISVQFRPDACPGPEETTYLFDEFISNLI